MKLDIALKPRVWYGPRDIINIREIGNATYHHKSILSQYGNIFNTKNWVSDVVPLIRERQKRTGLILIRQLGEDADIFKRLPMHQVVFRRKGYHIAEESWAYRDDAFLNISMSCYLLDSTHALTCVHGFRKWDSLGDSTDYLVENSRIIFDYDNEFNPAEDSIYRIKKIHRDSCSNCTNSDWAILELDKEVLNVTPLKSEDIVGGDEMRKGDWMYSIGHPLGLSAKFTPGARIVANDQEHYFRASLDAFSGTSGSPIFMCRDHRFVGIVKGLVPDYLPNQNGTHYEVSIDNELPGEFCQKIGSIFLTYKQIKNEFDRLPANGLSV